MKRLFETKEFIKGSLSRKGGNLQKKLQSSTRIVRGNIQDANQGAETAESEIFKTEKKGGVKKILEAGFARFDPQDQIVGLKNGRTWSQKLGWPLLAPQSVRGLENLELKGAAVLGSEVQLFGKSALKDSVLGSGISWKGALDGDIVLKISS